MLYSNEKGSQNSFRGKVWRLPNLYWRACNYNGQQCTYKLYNEALKFSVKGKPINEAMGSDKPVTVYAKDRKTVLGTVSKQSSSVAASKVAGGAVQQERVNGSLSWVLKEGLKRQQTRYRPELSRSEMESLVKNLKDQGYKATASGPNLKTDATDKAIEMAEGVVYIMCEDG